MGASNSSQKQVDYWIHASHCRGPKEGRIREQNYHINYSKYVRSKSVRPEVKPPCVNDGLLTCTLLHSDVTTHNSNIQQQATLQTSDIQQQVTSEISDNQQLATSHVVFDSHQQVTSCSSDIQQHSMGSQNSQQCDNNKRCKGTCSSCSSTTFTPATQNKNDIAERHNFRYSSNANDSVDCEG